MKVNELLMAVLLIVVVCASSALSFKSGKDVQQQLIVNYCKADNAYLDNGLMLQCQVVESKMRDRT